MSVIEGQAKQRIVRSSSHYGAFDAVVEGDRVVAARPFPHDPNPSILLAAIPQMVHHATRVSQPMIRSGWLKHGPRVGGTGRGGEPFVPVDWDLALRLVARDLQRVKTDYGNTAIFGGSYGWANAGRFHHAPTQLHRFLYRFGGCVGQLTNYSYGAALRLLPRVVGTTDPVTGPVTDWHTIAQHTRLFVAFGGLNPKNGRVNAGGAGTRTYEDWMRAAAAAGVRFVCIGPVRDDAPDFLNADWVAPRPNTDVTIMLALAHTLLTEELYDQSFLVRCCTGFERFKPYLTGAVDGVAKSSEWAGAIAGVNPEWIRNLARRMAATRTMLTASWSLQRAERGEQPYWMLIVLAAMLGQIGLPGGGFAFGYGSIDGMGNPRHRVPAPELEKGHNPIDLAIPVARLSDLLLDPGRQLEFDGRTIVFPDIKLVYWAGGNPFHHHQDVNRLLRGWRRPETVVVQEPWWTATARHADIVLPATTPLERNDIGASSRDRFVIAMKQAISPVGGARNDFDMLAELADRLGFAASFTEKFDELGWLRRLYDRSRAAALARNLPMPDFDNFWAAGHAELPAPIDPEIPFADFRADPQAHPLHTPSGRIEIWSGTIARFGYDDCPPHPAWLEPTEWLGSPVAERYPLHLLSTQPPTRLHGQMDPGPISRAAKVSGREALWIHPEDARSRCIAEGSVVRVFNDRGACLAGAKLTTRVRPGVVVLPPGAWYDPVEPGRPGALDKHGNANVLTLDKGTSRLGQGSVAQSALVEVERWDGPNLEVTAFEPPPTQQYTAPD
jgi:biotin/methionine sulfoxide reductase